MTSYKRVKHEAEFFRGIVKQIASGKRHTGQQRLAESALSLWTEIREESKSRKRKPRCEDGCHNCQWWCWDCNDIAGLCGNPHKKVICIDGQRDGFKKKVGGQFEYTVPLASENAAGKAE